MNDDAAPVSTDPATLPNISGVGTVANGATINTDGNVSVVTLATLESESLGNDLSLVIFNQQLYISAGNIVLGGDVDTSAINAPVGNYVTDRANLNSGGVSSPATLIPGEWYTVDVVVGDTVDRLTGTFRQDLDATLFTQESDITDTTQQ